MSDKLSNPVEEYFKDEGSKDSRFSELFKGNDEFIDQMTELDVNDIKLMLTLHENDRHLLSKYGLRSPVFASYMQKFMRLMVSKDRKSRGEYVDVHKAELQQEQHNPALSLTGTRLK